MGLARVVQNFEQPALYIRDMSSYPFFNFFLWALLIPLLLFKFNSLNKVESASYSVSGHILRHPYEEDGFQIIELQDYRFKTLIYPKYYLGEYITVKLNGNNNKFIYFPQIENSTSKTNHVMLYVAHFRDFIVTRVKSSLSQPHAGLILGFTLGYKQDYPPDFIDLLIITGTIHLVVFSGSNIAVISVGLFPLFYKFGNLIYFVFTTLLLVFIVLLVGLEAPVIRAALTKLIQNLAKVFGFDSGSLLPLFYSAAIMLFANAWYIKDLSFQLSFSAALIVVVISDLLSTIKDFRFKSLISSALIIVAIYPLVSVYFGSFSFKSLFVNLLVGFAVEKTLIPGFLYVLWPNFLLGIYLLVLSQYFIWVCEIIGDFSIFNTSFTINSSLAFAFYVGLALSYLIYRVFRLCGR